MTLGAAVLIVGVLALLVWSPGLRKIALVIAVVIGSFFAYDFYHWQKVRYALWPLLPAQLPGLRRHGGRAVRIAHRLAGG
jgi:hypothetical protein